MEKSLQYQLTIKASPEQVWDALTNSEKIAQYMFGARTHSDWKAGSPADYYVEQDGKEVVLVKGQVIRAEAPRYLEHTLFPATWAGMEDSLENYLIAVYELIPQVEGTLLNISQYDFTAVAEGEKRYQDASNGWQAVLPKLQAVAEGRVEESS